MRTTGSTRSRVRSLVKPLHTGAALALLAWQSVAHADVLRDVTIVVDAIPVSLTGKPGDATRGHDIVAARQNTCLLCHSGPFAEQTGNLAPDLAGTGSRWSEGQLRLRMVDASRLNPATIMPSYYRIEGLQRVATSLRGKPILSAEQIEDVVAYLATLRDEKPK